MKLYEMEGFLRGQCVPRDLLVNESNAAYLVRKLSEIASVKAERDALAVESASMREALDSIRIYSSDTLSGPSDSVPDMAAWLREGVEHLHQVSIIETPATGAALAAMRLEAKIEGANELAERIAEMHSKTAPGSNIEKKLMFAAEAAIAYANGLREAK